MKKRKLGGVMKRCQHKKSQHDTCSCGWHYAVQHDGKKHRGIIPGAVTEDDARRAYALIAARIKNGQSPFEAKATNANDRTIATLSEEWLSLPRGRKPSTIGFYRDQLRAHILPEFGERYLTTITRADLKLFISAHPGTDGLKRAVARSLHALFGFAVDEEYLSENPARGLVKSTRTHKETRTRIDRVKDRDKYFPAKEAKHLLDTCREQMPEWYLFFLTAIKTGMRLGELRALKFERISWWPEPSITVAENQTRWGVLSPKNGETRLVGMDQELRVRLYVRWRTLGRPKGVVFRSQVNKSLHVTTIERAWRKLQDLAELQRRVFHSLRHTHSTLAIEAGEDPVVVSEEAGRTLRETLDTYYHFRPSAKRSSAAKIDALLNPETRVSPERQSTVTKRPVNVTNRRANLRRVV